MQLTCPCCHARYPIDAAVQDEDARELLALSSGAADLWPLIVVYLAFFRPAKTALAWSRAKRLAKQTLELSADTRALAAALQEATDALAEKRAQGGWKPLSNHNYLKRVLESVEARLGAGAAPCARPATAHQAEAPRQPQSKGAQALVALEAMKR